MVGMKPGLSRETLVEELVAKAAELWGQERADQIRDSLAVAGGNLWTIAQNPPDPEQEPAYFML